jgi:hypothetical protein
MSNKRKLEDTNDGSTSVEWSFQPGVPSPDNQVPEEVVNTASEDNAYIVKATSPLTIQHIKLKFQRERLSRKFNKVLG